MKMTPTLHPKITELAALSYHDGLIGLPVEITDVETNKLIGNALMRLVRPQDDKRKLTLTIEEVTLIGGMETWERFELWVLSIEFGLKFQSPIRAIEIAIEHDKLNPEKPIQGAFEVFERDIDAFVDAPFARHVCYMGHQNETCRYLTAGASGFACAKFTSLKKTIDARVSSMSAQSDNCSGLLDQNNNEQLRPSTHSIH